MSDKRDAEDLLYSETSENGKFETEVLDNFRLDPLAAINEIHEQNPDLFSRAFGEGSEVAILDIDNLLAFCSSNGYSPERIYLTLVYYQSDGDLHAARSLAENVRPQAMREIDGVGFSKKQVERGINLYRSSFGNLGMVIDKLNRSGQVCAAKAVIVDVMGDSPWIHFYGSEEEILGYVEHLDDILIALNPGILDDLRWTTEGDSLTTTFNAIGNVNTPDKVGIICETRSKEVDKNLKSLKAHNDTHVHLKVGAKSIWQNKQELKVRAGSIEDSWKTTIVQNIKTATQEIVIADKVDAGQSIIFIGNVNGDDYDEEFRQSILEAVSKARLLGYDVKVRADGFIILEAQTAEISKVLRVLHDNRLDENYRITAAVDNAIPFRFYNSPQFNIHVNALGGAAGHMIKAGGEPGIRIACSINDNLGIDGDVSHFRTEGNYHIFLVDVDFEAKREFINAQEFLESHIHHLPRMYFDRTLTLFIENERWSEASIYLAKLEAMHGRQEYGYNNASIRDGNSTYIQILYNQLRDKQFTKQDEIRVKVLEAAYGGFQLGIKLNTLSRILEVDSNETLGAQLDYLESIEAIRRFEEADGSIRILPNEFYQGTLEVSPIDVKENDVSLFNGDNLVYAQFLDNTADQFRRLEANEEYINLKAESSMIFLDLAEKAFVNGESTFNFIDRVDLNALDNPDLVFKASLYTEWKELNETVDGSWIEVSNSQRLIKLINTIANYAGEIDENSAEVIGRLAVSYQYKLMPLRLKQSMSESEEKFYELCKTNPRIKAILLYDSYKALKEEGEKDATALQFLEQSVDEIINAKDLRAFGITLASLYTMYGDVEQEGRVIDLIKQKYEPMFKRPKNVDLLQQLVEAKTAPEKLDILIKSTLIPARSKAQLITNQPVVAFYAGVEISDIYST
ncbi:MAG: hypothetical protein Q9M91_00580 [Candidatus Dojkabacteria bacterium]|nr:hypothetical protein [Candidatus Dojkabacteria bacterium]